MLGLYLLAAHMLGDFVLSNRWQAARKLQDGRWRTYHVAVYCLPFLPILFVYAAPTRALAALVFLFGVHWLTDTRRFRSTLGDVVHWRLMGRERRALDVNTRLPNRRGEPTTLRPNPWEPIPLMIDQSLHVAQLALLAALFLR